MIQKILILFSSIIIATNVFSQTKSENTFYNKLSQTASFYTINKEFRHDTADCSSAEIVASYQNGETEGDFLVYQGKQLNIY